MLDELMVPLVGVAVVLLVGVGFYFAVLRRRARKEEK